MSPVFNREAAIVAAAGAELNDELTIILNSIGIALDGMKPGNPGRAALLEASASVVRCAWRITGMISYANRKGARPVATSAGALIDKWGYQL